MPEALKDGTVNEAAVTRAAGRVLYEIVHFGYMDGQSETRRHDPGHRGERQDHREDRRRRGGSAQERRRRLPLKAADLDSVVLIGPTGGQVDAIGINGERSVGLPDRQVGPLAAMRKISGNSDIGFAVADDMTGNTIPASALSHDGKPGLLRTGSTGAHS